MARRVRISGAATCVQLCVDNGIGSGAPAVGESVPGLSVDVWPWQADVGEVDTHMEEEWPPAQDC